MKGNMKTHICKYVTNVESSHVIMSQHKAWNNQHKTIMRFDLIKLFIKSDAGKILLWSDSCGSHKTPLEQLYVRTHHIDVTYLPPHKTSKLQEQQHGQWTLQL